MSRARLARILPHKAQNGMNDLVVKCINACQLQGRPEPWTKTGIVASQAPQVVDLSRFGSPPSCQTFRQNL